MAEQQEEQQQQAQAETQPAETPQAEEAATATAPEGGQEAPQARPVNVSLGEGRHYFWGTGRRKTAIARVRIRPGTGKFLVNKREMDQYFSEEKDRNAATAPLRVTHTHGSWDVFVNVQGGGYTGQGGAVSLGLSRAIVKALPDTEEALRDNGLLTRDARRKERKKYGLAGARRSYQFSKR